MSVEGKIQSLFIDREQTQAVFPTTKIKAVTDDNGVGLNAILEDMLYGGNLEGEVETAPIDADNLGGRPASEYATQSYVAAKIAEAQLSGEGGDIDLSGYATKDELNDATAKVLNSAKEYTNNEFGKIDYPVDSVNGKTGAVELTADDVGAHPNTWLPTIAQIGAAPGGYGYGEVPVSLGTADDEEAFVAALNEQFALTTSRVRKVRFTMGGGACTGELWSAGNGYGTLVANTYAVKNVGWRFTRMVRNCQDGEWQPWEYENPPMRSGVEYRTTERYLGKVVYAKVITGKALAVADTTVSISLDVTALTNIVDYIITHQGTTDSVYTFPSHGLYSGDPLLTGYFAKSNRSFVLQTHSDLSAHTATVFIKYTKD